MNDYKKFSFCNESLLNCYSWKCFLKRHIRKSYIIFHTFFFKFKIIQNYKSISSIFRANKIRVICNIIFDTNMNVNTPNRGSYTNIWPTIVSVGMPSKTEGKIKRNYYYGVYF